MQRKPKAIPTHRFYDSESKQHIPRILEESEVSLLVESMHSFFTKVDTVYECDELSVVRLIDPIMRFDLGYPKRNYLAGELFVATLTRGGKNKHIAIYSPVRVDSDGAIPDKEIRATLVKYMKQVWNIKI